MEPQNGPNGMKVGVPNQSASGEPRVALTPAVVKKLLKMDLHVVVEAGAGLASHYADQQYIDAGATIAAAEGDATSAIWAETDMVATLGPPSASQIAAMKSASVLIGLLAPLDHPQQVQALAAAKVTSFAMEFLPRISRAQSMDVLSSQANLGGYKAVLIGADHCPKMFPMMITAAGTIAPAKVFIIGAGVAGLQAIATAKRLGAVVEAFDVRAVTKEQVESLGARFVELPTAAQDDAATGGYARDQTEEERRKQSALMSKHVISADVIITTAAIFGKAPPMLIPKDTVEQMHAGSVIIDMAANIQNGRGNCELTEPGKTITTANGVTIIGETNLPALLPANASQVYANNMHAFISEMIEEGNLKLDLEDEVQKGAAITHDGQITNELVQKAIGAEAAV
jgi:NAD(P) transhydrogenase subunit alpha